MPVFDIKIPILMMDTIHDGYYNRRFIMICVCDEMRILFFTGILFWYISLIIAALLIAALIINCPMSIRTYLYLG